jgi:tetratricopeptide (TPR) repeat protein
MMLPALLLSVALAPVRAAPPLDPFDYRLPLNAALYADLDALWSRRGEAGAFDEHLERLRRERPKSPFDIQLLWRYGRALVGYAERSDSIWKRRKAYAEAVDALDTALDIDPSCEQARYWKVRALLRREPRSDEAAALLTTLTQLHR